MMRQSRRRRGLPLDGRNRDRATEAKGPTKIGILCTRVCTHNLIQHSGDHVVCGEEVARETVVACGDAPEVLHPTEHAFDRVSLAVEIRREAVLPPTVHLRWDVWCSAFALNLSSDGVSVIAFVAVHDAG